MSELEKWNSFYVFVGSAAAALIGLQFVVITLLAERAARSPEAGAAFGTPTVVHFSAAMILAGIVLAPWPNLIPAVVLWGVVGFIAFVYAVTVTWRMRKQNAYRPEFEDWLFHSILPLIAYLILATSALAALPYEREALFAVGTSAMLLLFIGIHNAWDAVTYHVYTTPASNRKKAEAES